METDWLSADREVLGIELRLLGRSTTHAQVAVGPSQKLEEKKTKHVPTHSETRLGFAHVRLQDGDRDPNGRFRRENLS